ncbi:MAG: hypothetical protein VW708_01915 [Ilumatobacter sp.]
MSGPIGVTEARRPGPTAGVAAAFAAAVEALWPRPVPAVASERGSTAWRFSGRWWTDEPVSSPGAVTRPW